MAIVRINPAVRIPAGSVTSTNTQTPIRQQSGHDPHNPDKPQVRDPATESGHIPPSLKGRECPEKRTPPICTECQRFHALDGLEVCDQCHARRLNPGELGPYKRDF